LHEKIDLMVFDAKKINTIDSVEITTNAALLTENKAAALINSGLDTIRISIEHVHNNGYKRLTKTEVSYGDIRKNVAFLYNEKVKQDSTLHVHVKIIDTALSESEKEKFLADFSSISDSINIDKPMGWSMSFEKEMDMDISDIKTGISGVTEKRERTVCPEPFSKLAVNFNGTVSVCCADWSHGTLVGDLKEESLLDIWRGDKLKKIRLLHLTGNRRQIASCRNCDYMKGFADITDLDRYADILIEKYK
jgi:radical SAM protein with 4Fe4S-binding SPASM domain